MIREALDKIQSWIEDANKKEQIEINGDIYTERNLKLVTPHVPKRSRLELNSLTSLVSNLKAEVLKEGVVSLPLRLLVGEQSVEVYSDLDVNYDREHLYTVRAQNPRINYNEYISVEEMIIQLQTGFVNTENKAQLIQMISRLKKDNTVEMDDDGISQIVSLKSGVTSASAVTVPPLVWLAPIRTFFEIEQPEQMFLVRINQRGEVALFDAGGGIWKHDCQTAIRQYLSVELKELLDEGLIVIG